VDNDILLLLMLALFTGEYDDKHVKWEGGCKFCFVSESEAHENPRKDEKELRYNEKEGEFLRDAKVPAAFRFWPMRSASGVVVGVDAVLICSVPTIIVIDNR
jgi:hypothetical protein